MGKGKRYLWLIAAALAAIVLAVALWQFGAPAETVLQPSPTLSMEALQSEAPMSSPETAPFATPSPEPSPPPDPSLTAVPTAEPTEPSQEQICTLPLQEQTCTLSIRCDTVLNHWDALDPEKAELIPANGTLLAETDVAFEAGDTAFDALKRACRDGGVHLEFSTTPGYGSAYIEGIGNLYEFDCGERSGWLYKVNGQVPDVACSAYVLEAGDRVEFLYSCDWGWDI